MTVDDEIPSRPEAEALSPAAGIGEWLLRTWERIVALPAWAFVGWVGVLLVLRTGVRGGGTEELRLFAGTFPEPGPSYRSYAVIGPFLGWLTRATSVWGWRILHVAAITGWFVLTAALLRRRVPGRGSWRLGIVWLSFLSMPTAMLRQIGWYDVYTLTGASLVVIGGTPPLALVGGLFLGASNAEQAVVLLGCAALVHVALPSDLPGAAGQGTTADRLRLYGVALLGVVLARTGVEIWFRFVDADVQSRRDIFGQLLDDSLVNAASLGPLGIYTWLGAGWVVALFVVWSLRHHPWRAAAAVAGLVVIPALATVATLDGTRVFAAVSSGAMLLALLALLDAERRPGGLWIRQCAAALMCFGWLVPAVTSLHDGDVPPPWQYVVEDLLGLG